jgi:hypothetical protein
VANGVHRQLAEPCLKLVSSVTTHRPPEMAVAMGPGIPIMALLLLSPTMVAKSVGKRGIVVLQVSHYERPVSMSFSASLRGRNEFLRNKPAAQCP